MNNVVSLEDKSKDDRIKALEEELREYKNSQTIQDYSDEIANYINRILRETAFSLAEEDDMAIAKLQELLAKLKKVFDD